MRLKTIFTVGILLFCAPAFAQDTTGGTRPTLIIPLHKSRAKKEAEAKRSDPAYRIDSLMKTPGPVNPADRKQKRKKKNSSKP